MTAPLALQQAAVHALITAESVAGFIAMEPAPSPNDTEPDMRATRRTGVRGSRRAS